MGFSLLVGVESLPQAKEFKYPGFLRVKWSVRWTDWYSVRSAAGAVLVRHGEEGAELEGKALVNEQSIHLFRRESTGE